jgi:hypothetical protein
MNNDQTTDTGAAGATKPFAALDAIKLEAAGNEQARDDAAAAAQQEGEPDQAEVWALIPKQLGKMLGMALPELRAVYTDEACRDWGIGMAAVSQKYGWDAADTLAKFGPELALASATIPLAVPTYYSIRKRLDAAAEAKARQVGESQKPMKDVNSAPGAGNEPQ